MKTAEQLRQFYQTELLPGLIALEQIRKQQIQRQIFIFLAVIVSVIIALVLILPTLVLLFLAVFLGLYFIFFGSKRKRFDFKKAHKEIVLKKLIDFILPGFTHTSFQYLPQKLYDISKLFIPSPQIYTGEDYVEGVIGNTAIKFSEIHTQEVITDDRGRTHNSTIFKGIFFIADLKRECAADIYIFSDKSEKFQNAFNKWFQDINTLKPEMVKTGILGFDNNFELYSTESDTAVSLCTKHFTDLVTAYRERTNAQVQIALHSEKLFVAVPLRENLFDVSLYKSVLKFTDAEVYYSAINFCISVTEAIQDNKGIWT